MSTVHLDVVGSCRLRRDVRNTFHESILIFQLAQKTVPQFFVTRLLMTSTPCRELKHVLVMREEPRAQELDT